LGGTIVAFEKVASGGKSFHTIPIIHGILKGGPLDANSPNDEDGGPSCGGPWNNGPSKVFSMFCTLIGMWDLLPQHLTRFERLFHTLYTKRVPIRMFMFGFSERSLMQMEKKTMQISIVLFYIISNSLKDKAKNILL
jgi:hypothetical protein